MMDLGPLYFPTCHIASFSQIKIFKEESAIGHLHQICHCDCLYEGLNIGSGLGEISGSN